MDEKRDVHREVDVDDRRKPVGAQVARVRDDEKGARHHFADLHGVRRVLDRRRRDEIPDRRQAFLVEEIALARFFRMEQALLVALGLLFFLGGEYDSWLHGCLFYQFQRIDVLDDRCGEERWIVAVIKEFDDLFGRECCRPHSGTRKRCCHLFDTLEELAPIGLEKLSVEIHGFLLIEDSCQLPEEAAPLIFRRRERHDDIEILGHDVRDIRQILDEILVFRDLETQKLVFLDGLFVVQELQIRLHIEASRARNDLDREVERIQKSLVLADNRILLLARLEIEIERRDEKHRTERSAFEHDDAVADFFDVNVALRAGCASFLFWFAEFHTVILASAGYCRHTLPCRSRIFANSCSRSSLKSFAAGGAWVPLSDGFGACDIRRTVAGLSHTETFGRKKKNTA